MAISIVRVGEKYIARVTPPHGHGTPWATDEPMISAQLIEALVALGCHQTDIGDAFYEADPEWLLRTDE